MIYRQLPPSFLARGCASLGLIAARVTNAGQQWYHRGRYETQITLLRNTV
jgi:hypothetical protein